MAEAAADLGTSVDADRYYRIVRLLRAGTKIIRKLFDFIHDPSTFQNIMLRHKATLQSLRPRILSEVEWNKLYPSNSSYGKSCNFDLTLLFKLLRNICNLTSPTTGWDKLPQDTDLSLEADIARIKYHRNTTFAHNDEMELSEDEFADYWEQIKDALLRIVGYYEPSDVRELEKQIDKSRTSAITEEDRKNFLTEFPGIAIKCAINVAKSIWEYYRKDVQSLLKEIQDAIFSTAGIIVEMINAGSVVIQIRVTNVDALDDFWKRYQTGELRNDFEKVLVTEEIRRLGNQVELTVSVSEDEYLHAQNFFDELGTYRKKINNQKVKEDEDRNEKVKQLFQSIRENNIANIKKLIEDGLDVKDAVEGPAKITVLHCLAEVQSERESQITEEDLKQMFKLFLSENCSVNSKDEYGNTPLKFAAEKGNVTILICLLKNNADSNIKDKYKEDTPLHWAAKKGKAEAVEILCKSGANIDDQNKEHKTPLHLAVESDKKDVVVRLLINGAVKTLKDNNESTPLDVAKRNNFTEIAKILQKSVKELVHSIESTLKIPVFRKEPGQGEHVVPDASPRSITNVYVYGQAAIGPNATFVTNELSSFPSNVNTQLTQSTVEPSAPPEETEPSSPPEETEPSSPPEETEPSSPTEETEPSAPPEEDEPSAPPEEDDSSES